MEGFRKNKLAIVWQSIIMIIVWRYTVHGKNIHDTVITANVKANHMTV